MLLKIDYAETPKQDHADVGRRCIKRIPHIYGMFPSTAANTLMVIIQYPYFYTYISLRKFATYGILFKTSNISSPIHPNQSSRVPAESPHHQLSFEYHTIIIPSIFIDLSHHRKCHQILIINYQ